MPTAPAPRKLTYDDFAQFPDDDRLRHELIDGVHYVTPSPASAHQRVIGNLHFLMRLYLETHPAGEVFLAPFDVVFTVYDVVEPDLLFISTARKDVLTEANVQGSPDLVVEVLSPSTRRRDEGVKLRLYERTEVLEYWVIDPRKHVARVYRRDNGGLACAETLQGNQMLTSPILPDLAMPLTRIFEGT